MSSPLTLSLARFLQRSGYFGLGAGCLVALLSVSFSPGQAHARVDLDKRCHIVKLTVSGRYGMCRVRQLMRIIDRGSPDYERCERRLLSAWDRADRRGGVDCPRGDGVLTTIRTEIETSADAIAAALPGGTGSPGDVECELGKLEAMSRSILCLAKLDARAVRKGEPAPINRCVFKCAKRWGGLENSFGSDCPAGAGDWTDLKPIAVRLTDRVNVLLDPTLATTTTVPTTPTSTTTTVP